jgi:hypothetical protein
LIIGIYACPELGTEFLYIYVLPLEIQLSRFNPTPIYACPELGTEFLLAYVVESKYQNAKVYEMHIEKCLN